MERTAAQVVTTPAQEALVHLKNAAIWLSAAAQSDPLCADRALRVATEALSLETYINQTRPVRVVTVSPGADRVWRA